MPTLQERIAAMKSGNPYAAPEVPKEEEEEGIVSSVFGKVFDFGKKAAGFAKETVLDPLSRQLITQQLMTGMMTVDEKGNLKPSSSKADKVPEDFVIDIPGVGRVGPGLSAKEKAGLFAETASFAVGGGAATTFGKQFGKQGLRALLSKSGLKLAGQEAGAGALGAGGFTAGQKDSTAGEIATSAAIGAGIGAVAGPALTIGGTKLSQLIGKKAVATPAVKKAVTEAVPTTQPKLSDLITAKRTGIDGRIPSVADQVNTSLKQRVDSISDKIVPPSVKKLDTTKQAKEVILDEAEKLSETAKFKAITDRVSIKQITDEAAVLDIGVKELQQAAAESVKNRAILVKSKDSLRDSAENVQTLAQRFKDEGNNLSVTEKQALLDEINLAVETHREIYLATRELIAESGRTLVANKALNRQVKEATDGINVIAGPDDVDTLLDLITKNGTGKGINQYIKNQLVDKVLMIRKSGLLSGPSTHLVNLQSNLFHLLMSLPERALAATGSNAARLITRKPANTTYREVLGQATGNISALPKGVQQGFKTLVSGKPLTGKALEAAGRTEIKGPIGKAVKVPFRLLEAADEAFKTVWRAGEINAQAVKTAQKEKLKGAAFKKRVQALIDKPTDAMLKQADDAALLGTFQEPGSRITRLINSARNSDSITLKVLTDVVFPFARTPVNIFRQVIERTPFAPASKRFREAFKKGGAPRDIALARAALGTTMMGATVAATTEGMITGAGPSSSKKRAALKRQGWQPYSIKVGDKYHSYKRVEPIGTIIGVVATATEQYMDNPNEDTFNKMRMVAGAFIQATTDKSFMTGFNQFATLIDDPNGWGKNIPGQIATSFVPASSFLRTLRNMNDKYFRNTDGVWDQIANIIPFYSEKLTPKRDAWGQPIERVGTIPGTTTEAISDKLETELFNLQFYPSVHSNTFNAWEWDAEGYDKYLETVGEAKREVFEQLIETDEYKNASIDEKHDILDSAQRKVAAATKDEIGVQLMAEQIGAFDKITEEQLLEAYGKLRAGSFDFDQQPQSFKEEKLKEVLNLAHGLNL